MKGKRHMLARDAVCVLAAGVCGLCFSGCEMEPVRTASASVPAGPGTSRPMSTAVAPAVARKPQPARITAANVPAPVAHAAQPRGDAWQRMPGASYSEAAAQAAPATIAAPRTAPTQLARAATPRPAPLPAVPAAATPRPAPAAPSPASGAPAAAASRPSPPAAAAAQSAAVAPVALAAPAVFGAAEAAAVRFAGGPCSADIYRIVWDAAGAYRIQPEFVAALIEIESGCRSDAVSQAGAHGLMQLVPASGAREGYRFMHGRDHKPTIAELHDPAVNIRLGVAYLGALQDHFDYIDAPLPRLILMVAAYNCGPYFFDQRLPAEAAAWNAEQAVRWVRHNAPQETRDFVDAVLRKAALYSGATLRAQTGTVVSSRLLSP